MAREKCAGCFGSGRGVNGGPCTFCSGMGTIWVPDKVSYSGRNRVGQGGSGSKGSSWFDNAFEDNLASVIMFIIWGFGMYHAIETTAYEWYVPMIIAFVVGIVAYKLVAGPLRPIATILKYLFYLGLLAFFVYGIYIVVSMII
ncbi:hypothetical protein [Aestuariivivens sediminicola]|uniref:hypothetical protein n=1 Tax=Aestuariivivens sediminicola TaxID=2913560 RepID=UPI001F589B4D|nr:hypothetical protein [Aestuariivivens sediminicola]